MTTHAVQRLAIVLINVRSAHNVGTIWRTADACAAAEVILVGITPHPQIPDDTRPGHVVSRHEREIAKSALGAEKSVSFRYFESFAEALQYARAQDYSCFALECNRAAANNLFKHQFSASTALFVGSETAGLNQAECDQLDATLEIPMFGTKGSLNVAVAASIGMYQVRTG